MKEKLVVCSFSDYFFFDFYSKWRQLQERDRHTKQKLLWPSEEERVADNLLFACLFFSITGAIFYVEDCDFPGENESERYVKGGGALTSSIATQTKKKRTKKCLERKETSTFEFRK